MWETNKSAGSAMSLLARLDYQRGLQQQLPGPAIRVVYSASGMYLAAAIVEDSTAVVEHKLYWAAAESMDEAMYLVTILNSNTLLQMIQPLQARGEHNPRDFDKYVWQAPIPLFDPTSELHREIVLIGSRAQDIAKTVELPNQSFQALRRRIRTALVAGNFVRCMEYVLHPRAQFGYSVKVHTHSRNGLTDDVHAPSSRLVSRQHRQRPATLLGWEGVD